MLNIQRFLFIKRPVVCDMKWSSDQGTSPHSTLLNIVDTHVVMHSAWFFKFGTNWPFNRIKFLYCWYRRYYRPFLGPRGPLRTPLVSVPSVVRCPVVPSTATKIHATSPYSFFRL